MVIFAALGAALLPITSTSFLGAAFGNSMTKAYYLAEAGYRYAASQFLAGTGETARDNVFGVLHNKTYNLSGAAGSFQLLTYPYYYKTTALAGQLLATEIKGGFPAGRTIPTSGRLEIKDTAGAALAGSPFAYSNHIRIGAAVTFTLSAAPSAATFAAVAANSLTVLPVLQTTAVQSMSKNGNLTVGNVADQNTFPALSGSFQLLGSNTTYAYEKRSGNILQNITNYNDPTAVFTVSVPGGQDVVLLKYLELHSTGSVGSANQATSRLLRFYGPIAAIAADQGAGFPPENTVDLAALAAASGGTSTGRFSTVDLGGDTALTITQTTGGSGAGSQPSTEAYVTLPSGTSNPIYLSWSGAGGYLSYDIQVKVATGDWHAGTGSFVNKPDTYCAGVLFRAGGVLSNQSTFYGLSLMRSNNYGGNQKDGVPDSMVPPSQNDKAMLVLWTRNGAQGGGDDNWMAYRLLDEAGGTDYIVDNAGHVRDWSTVLARVIEGASLKLTAPTVAGINIGDTITGGAGTAILFRIINDSDGNVVLLLNNVVGTFTRPATVGIYTTDAAWGYRPRDNYIWAFYTDTGDHSANATPLDNTRLGQTRGAINWPITDVQSWAAGGDRFSLVQWNGSLNTAQDVTLRIMGAGKEAGAIIRTNKWTTGGYTAGSFPPEIGIVSLGESSVKTYFDDLSYYLRGGLSSGGGGSTGFLPPVQQ